MGKRLEKKLTQYTGGRFRGDSRCFERLYAVIYLLVIPNFFSFLFFLANKLNKMGKGRKGEEKAGEREGEGGREGGREEGFVW